MQKWSVPVISQERWEEPMWSSFWSVCEDFWMCWLFPRHLSSKPCSSSAPLQFPWETRRTEGRLLRCFSSGLVWKLVWRCIEQEVILRHHLRKRCFIGAIFMPLSFRLISWSPPSPSGFLSLYSIIISYDIHCQRSILQEMMLSAERLNTDSPSPRMVTAICNSCVWLYWLHSLVNHRANQVVMVLNLSWHKLWCVEKNVLHFL